MKYEDPCAASGSGSPYAIGFQKQRKRSVLMFFLTCVADYSCSCLWIMERAAHCWKNILVPWHGDMRTSHVPGPQTAACSWMGRVCSAPPSASVWMSLCIMVSLYFGLVTGLVSAQGTATARSLSCWQASLQMPSPVPSPWLSAEGRLTRVACKSYSAHGVHGP